MTGQRSKFKELNKKVTWHVSFGDKSIVNIEEKCSITFRCKNGEEQTLQKVYYIPNLCNNIISIGQLSENGKRHCLGVSLCEFMINKEITYEG